MAAPRKEMTMQELVGEMVTLLHEEVTRLRERLETLETRVHTLELARLVGLEDDERPD